MNKKSEKTIIRSIGAFGWIAIVVLALVIATSASAGYGYGITAARAVSAKAVTPKPLPIPTLEDDVQLARDYWGWQKSPYCTTETIIEKEILWGGEEEDGGDWRNPGPCSIRIITIGQLEERITNLLPGEPGFVKDKNKYAAKARELRCRIVVHEVGHMYGLDHSLDPNNIMFWKISFTAVIPACEARMTEGVVNGKRENVSASKNQNRRLSAPRQRHENPLASDQGGKREHRGGRSHRTRDALLGAVQVAL